MPGQRLKKQGRVELWDNGVDAPEARFSVRWGENEQMDYSRLDQAEMKFDEEIQAARFDAD
ncbi:hypothetical protein [Asticcacaulis sp. 201]|uniref:hypothetical protein n=1 Tax=Asticcacaulis sp. 201 TaxID=3028787 RepID=UPI002915CDA0|nr:hypothetical protein [Asticcacaulis sp. 201]MDV6333092.1 hypothetical protein [Asticcacaulis sp. 201]